MKALLFIFNLHSKDRCKLADILACVSKLTTCDVGESACIIALATAI